MILDLSQQVAELRAHLAAERVAEAATLLATTLQRPELTGQPALRVQLALAAAELARRSGHRRDARQWLSDARRALAELPVGETQRELATEVAWGEASEAIAAGAHARAARLLEASMADARTLFSGQALRFHRALGAIAARQGRAEVAVSHYRLALQQLDEDRDPDLAARLRSNLAMVELQRGGFQEALQLIARAIHYRSRPGAAAAPLANSLAVQAMIAESSGRSPDWDRPLELARSSGDNVLYVEIALRSAQYRYRSGGGAGAGLVLRAAERLLAEVGRQEPMLRALWLETRALEQWVDGGAERAIPGFLEALEAFEALDAVWQALRVELSLGVVEAEAGRAETGRARAVRVCRRAAALGLELPMEAASRALVIEAARAGDPTCAAWARRHGWPAPLPQVGGATLDPASGTLSIGAFSRVMGPRSLLFRLLWLLAEGGSRGVTVRELERRLWRRSPPGPARTTRLRSLIARARSLTAPEHVVILTVAGEGRYRWNPDVDVVALGRAEKALQDSPSR
jgi:tetratricopeptide (TPR) repeat protein